MIESFTHREYRLRLVQFQGGYFVDAENTAVKGRRLRRRWSLRTKDLAEARRKFFKEVEILEKRGFVPDLFESGISGWIDRFLKYSEANSRTRGTFVSHRGTIEKFRKFIRAKWVKEITPEVYESYKEYLLTLGLERRTIDVHLTTIKKMLTVLESLNVIPRGAVPRPILYNAKKTSAPKFWTEDEIARILAAAEGTYIQDMLLFILNTGLRLNEIRHLRWEDVGKGFITIQGYTAEWAGDTYTFEPKDHHVRRIKLNAAAWEVIERMREEAFSPWVFATHYGRPRYNNLGRDFGDILKKAGVTNKGRWHAGRRTFGSFLLMADTDVKSVQLLYGHARLSTTQSYVNVTDQHLDKSVDKIGFRKK